MLETLPCSPVCVPGKGLWSAQPGGPGEEPRGFCCPEETQLNPPLRAWVGGAATNALEPQKDPGLPQQGA